MIEELYAARLGATVIIRPDGGVAADRLARQASALGLRHLRLIVDLAELDTVFGDILARLSDAATILLSPVKDCPDRLGRLLDRHASQIDAVEIGADAHNTADNADLMTASARRVRDAGKMLILAAGAWTPLPLHIAALLQTTHAIGVESWDALPLAALQAAQAQASGLQVWLTPSTRAPVHQPSAEIDKFLGAVSTDAHRFYIPAAVDGNGRVTTGGLCDAAGEPTLLARLLAGGVGEVQRVMGLAQRSRASRIKRSVLVTGGAGFIGANLVDRLASLGHHVHVYDALARPGVERNLRWLAKRHPAKISFELGDLRDEPALEEAAARAEAVFHLAGQVAVTTSMARPLDDFDVNARGTLALLDALRRRNPNAPLIYASTNKVYGDLADIELARDGDRYLPTREHLRANGVSESRPLCFHTPYGCSKGTADQYVLDYAHSFGLRTAVLRMSCIYGERQFGTEDQGWVAHFLLRAIAGEPVTIYGDGRQVRDVLHVGDAVDAYIAAWRDIGIIAGRAYNLGGGPANAISLLQLITHMEAMLDTRVDVTFSAWRPGDQRYFVADTQAIRRDLHLPQALDWRAGLGRLATHFGARLHQTAEAAEPAL